MKQDFTMLVGHRVGEGNRAKGKAHGGHSYVVIWSFYYFSFIPFPLSRFIIWFYLFTDCWPLLLKTRDGLHPADCRGQIRGRAAFFHPLFATAFTLIQYLKSLFKPCALILGP